VNETLQPTSREEYSAQGKSNNFLAASAAGRLTAGQAAKLLSHRLGRKITAKEIEPLAVEFHHAGRFAGDRARRVFFFSPEELERITLSEVEGASSPLWGWVLGFRAERGRRGRKVYVPIVAEVGQFAADKAHRLGDKFHPLSAEEAEEARTAVSKTLPAFSQNWREAR
jgi:hypothetical protein